MIWNKKSIDHAEASRLIVEARTKLWAEFRGRYKTVPMDEWETYFAEWHARYLKAEVAS